MYEEYVLVCIEWKFGFGYIGFICYVVLDVMLEDDFKCCDLIINVLVQDDNGEIIDLYNGLGDL